MNDNISTLISWLGELYEDDVGDFVWQRERENKYNTVLVWDSKAWYYFCRRIFCTQEFFVLRTYKFFVPYGKLYANFKLFQNIDKNKEGN